MLKTQARPVFKLKYFQCKKQSEHEGQVLNYVCISKNCESKGLICSVCKNDHITHDVIPLKYLLNSLRSHKQKPMQSQNFQSDLQQLQQIKNSFLYELKCVVQKFAQKIQSIEEQIIETFKNKKIQLLNQIQLNLKFNEIIEETLNNNLSNQDSFEKDFRTIASLIDHQKKQQFGKNLDQLSFSINLKNIVKEYNESYLSYSTRLNLFLEQSSASLNKLLNCNKVEQAQSSIKVQIPQIPQTFNKSQYAFSSTLKGTNMTISNNQRTVSCANSSSQRFALIDGTVQKKGSVIRFKIDKLKNWIGLGLAIRNNIISKNYQFLYNSIGHGSFLLSNNNYSWSHAFTANNLQASTFSFAEGDIIKIQVNQTQLIYTNESQQNKVCILPILLNQSQWKEACFCVNLCSVGDSATIL